MFEARAKPAALNNAFRCTNGNNCYFASGNLATMPPKGASTKLVPPRLPPLPKLRVRRPNRQGENPCDGIMTSVLCQSCCLLPQGLNDFGADSLYVACWASAGNAAAGCQQLEQSLRACMDKPVRLFPFLLDAANGGESGPEVCRERY